MKKAIEYCYYRPDTLEFLNNVLKIIAFLYHIEESKVRDSLNSSIRTFNNSNNLPPSHELYKFLYNNGKQLTLKDFLERIVLYLIRTKKKGRIF